MNAPRIPGAEAAQALTEVHRRREQVVTGTLVPDWYWAAIGAATAAFIAAVDNGRPWVVGIGTVFFVAGISVPLGYVLTRRRVQVYNPLLGYRGGLAIAGFVVATVVGSLAVAFGLTALGVPLAATIAGILTGVGLAVGGPRLMRHLRELMSTRPVGGVR